VAGGCRIRPILTAFAMGRPLFLAVLVLAAGLIPVGARDAQPPASPVATSETAGAQVCATCHAEQHDAWTSGRHSKMIQPASAASVLGDFTRQVITLRGQPYALRRANGAYYITESRLTGRPQEHRIDYTLGSRRIQHFLTTIDHGRIVVLPPTWDVQRREWFDNVEIIRPDQSDTAPVQQWNKNCVGCHVSRQDNRYSAATATYDTTWQDFGTSCERCHGPGQAHVDRYRADPASRPVEEREIVRPTRLAPAAGSAVCAQCHSLRDIAAPGFRAGAAYDDHFVVKLEYTPRKEQDPVYWADGRPRRFSNDAVGLWQSQCYLKGGATCTTCHDPHTPNVDRHATLAPTNNALCATCHAEIGRQVVSHSRHAAGSRGASCIECHMPKEVVSIKASMRDHSMSLPTPENTVAYGIPNACTTCHVSKTAPWAAARMAEWWPNGRRAANVTRAATFTAARAGRSDALPGLVAMAADDTAAPLMRANALGYLRAYDEPRAVEALTRALAAGTPTERMVAASSLRQAGSRDALMAALADASRAVRVSALVSLVNLGAGPLTPTERARVRFVSEEFAAQAALHEDDAVTQADLGMVRLVNGDLARADAALEIALGLAPRDPKATFLLGLTRLGQQRAAEARRLFEQVPASASFYRAAQERLKRLAAGG
jgi:predicted CXXCH cytochrome family protein